MKTILKTVGLLFAVSVTFLSLQAQEINVSGTVFDQLDNSPLSGVNVVEKGTSNGTVTGPDGKYSIKVNKGKTLVFSCAGFESKQVKARASTLDVYLFPSVEYQMEAEAVIMDMNGSPRPASQTIMQYKRHSISPFPLPPALNTEEYASHKENRFLSAVKDPLSTFSLDVDAASYGIVRRMINQGVMPRAEAVRVEEMINYFSYDYPQPTGQHPVNILTEATVCPWNSKHKIVKIGVKAKEIASEKLPPSNFVFLIDVSGSMYDANKLPLVKSSMKLLVNNLRPTDRVSIVTYAGAAGEALPSTSGSDKQKILDALENLTAGGSTAGGEGIQLAYKIAGKNFVKEGNNRVILCTDGDFNVGVSTVEGLESLIEAKRKTGIFLTVLGYGMGNYKDNKLQTLAQKGNGNQAYIDNLQEANKVLVNEFGSTMHTVAKDVKLQVEFNPKFVNAYRLVGYESRLLDNEDFNDDSKDAGELGAGHTVTAFYEIVPVGVKMPVGQVDKLKYQEQKEESAPRLTDSNDLLTVKLRYKNTNADVSQKMEVPVLANAPTATPSDDFNFALAVAMFGQLLKDSEFKGDATYDKVIDLAGKNLSNDANGYRHEFVRLVEVVKQLEK